jgi:hypothetical protein
MPEQLRLSITPEALAVAFNEMSFTGFSGYLATVLQVLVSAEDPDKSA